jgi:threonine dehydrogenase-like Zn-dependent dehydrogenase
LSLGSERPVRSPGHGQKYVPRLLGHVAKGELDPSFLVTHRLSLENAAQGYAMFKNKTDGCLRAVFAPS